MTELILDPEIWTRWRKLSEHRKPSITLRLETALPDAAGLLKQAADAAVTEIEDDLRRRGQLDDGDGDGELSPGSVMVTPGSGAALMWIGEYPADFERLVRRTGAILEASQVSGRLSVEPPAPDLPDSVPLIECRIRARGERYATPNQRPAWRADPASFARGVEAAVKWCQASASDGPLTMQVYLATTTIAPGDEVLGLVTRVLTAYASYGTVTLTSFTTPRFRLVALDA